MAHDMVWGLLSSSFQQQRGGAKPYVSRPRYHGTGKRSYDDLANNNNNNNINNNDDLREQEMTSDNYFNGYEETTRKDAGARRLADGVDDQQQQQQRGKGYMPYRMRHRYFGGKKKKDGNVADIQQDNVNAGKNNDVAHKNNDMVRKNSGIRGILLLRENTRLDDVLSAALKKRGYRIEKIMKEDTVKNSLDSGKMNDNEVGNNDFHSKRMSRTYNDNDYSREFTK